VRIQVDPLFFVKEVLGGEPWQKEADILLSVRDNKYTAVRSGHGVGKTYSAARAALWFLVAFKGSIVITTAPTWRQVRMLLWGEIRGAVRNARCPEMFRGSVLLDTRLTVDDGWYALGLSTDEPDNFQGFHAENLLVIIDEASGVGRSIYEACESLMTSANCKMLAIGNPLSPSGWFFDAFQNPGWQHIHISSYDCPNVTQGGMPYPKLVIPEWIKRRELDWGRESPLFQSRVLGEFPQEGEDTLIPLSWLEWDGPGSEGEPALGVDVARFGSDETVILKRSGMVVKEVIAARGIATTETAGRVKVAGEGIKPENIKIDVIGVGGGVVDNLHEQGLMVNGVNFAETAQDAVKFKNVRAECYWAVRDAVRPDAENRLYIPDKFRKLKAQLSALKYKIDSRGRIQIEPKEEFKKRMGYSPDQADALAISLKPGAPILSAVWI